jgi:ectoine hydroxylase-related dioxygenase (phytanoyl-CoA dioxygenase family)
VARKTGPFDSAVAHFHEHGYVVLPAYLGTSVLAPAQDELGVLFPTPEEYHSAADPDRNARFSGNPFTGIDPFPYKSVEWSLLGLCSEIDELASALLGTSDIRLYEAHNWAKYGGATEYDQPLHRDFSNHTMVVPTSDPAFADVEMFVYIHDVPAHGGPTFVVSQSQTGHIPPVPPIISRQEHPETYRHEVAADGPAGTVLAYKTDTFHRGSGITDPLGSRFVLKVSFRAVTDIWFDKLGLSERVNRPEWVRFVERANPRQLELVGFPPRGHAYWTEDTWAATSTRYPAADLSAFRPT